MERMSTPVAAMAATVSRLMPPDAFGHGASICELDRCWQIFWWHVVEQDHLGTGLERLGQLVESIDLDFHDDRVTNRVASPGARPR